MDCLGLCGENPMMPPPPKVWPLPVGLAEEPNAEPLDVPEPAPVPAGPVPATGLPLASVPPPVGLPVEAADPEPAVPLELPKRPVPALELWLPLLPVPELMPVFPPAGPMPAPLATASGWPKKPMAWGVLFWPKRTGFHSALPVVGSIYFLRRKRMSLVLTSASILGG